MTEQGELFDHCDICVGVAEDGEDGWVDLLANKRAQEAVQAVFPEKPIQWNVVTEMKMPPGWKIACINVPALVASSLHKLVRIENESSSMRDVLGEIMQLATSLHLQGVSVMVRSQQGRYSRFEASHH